MITNIETAKQAVNKAEAIIAGGLTKSSEFTIQIQDYRNEFPMNTSPEVQAKILLEDTAKAICQADDATFDSAVEALEACSAKHNLKARI